MATTRVRIGVIGCGFYARNHLHAWHDLAAEGAVLTAVCDRDAGKAREAGRDFGVPFYTDAAELLANEQLDAVDIVTRVESHRPLCEMTIARGLATIIQKPFAPDWQDCIAIVDAAARAGVWLAVHENFRFQAPMRRVRDVIASGAIGAPNWARIRFRTGFDVYAAQPYLLDERRLVIADAGVHMLDLARFFMGDVVRISCEVQSRNRRVKGEDTATMLLRHESGAVSVVEATFDAHREPDPFPETLLEIEGDLGTVLVDAGCRMTLTRDGRTTVEDIGVPLLSWTAHPWHVSQQGAFAACRHFLECLQHGVPAETSGADNLKTYALVDAAYLAAAEHRTVTPKTHDATLSEH